MSLPELLTADHRFANPVLPVGRAGFFVLGSVPHRKQSRINGQEYAVGGILKIGQNTAQSSRGGVAGRRVSDGSRPQSVIDYQQPTAAHFRQCLRHDLRKARGVGVNEDEVVATR